MVALLATLVPIWLAPRLAYTAVPGDAIPGSLLVESCVHTDTRAIHSRVGCLPFLTQDSACESEEKCESEPEVSLLDAPSLLRTRVQALISCLGAVNEQACLSALSPLLSPMLC